MAGVREGSVAIAEMNKMVSSIRSGNTLYDISQLYNFVTPAILSSFDSTYVVGEEESTIYNDDVIFDLARNNNSVALPQENGRSSARNGLSSNLAKSAIVPEWKIPTDSGPFVDGTEYTTLDWLQYESGIGAFPNEPRYIPGEYLWRTKIPGVIDPYRIFPKKNVWTREVYNVTNRAVKCTTEMWRDDNLNVFDLDTTNGVGLLSGQPTTTLYGAPKESVTLPWFDPTGQNGLPEQSESNIPNERVVRFTGFADISIDTNGIQTKVFAGLSSHTNEKTELPRLISDGRFTPQYYQMRIR